MKKFHDVSAFIISCSVMLLVSCGFTNEAAVSSGEGTSDGAVVTLSWCGGESSAARTVEPDAGSSFPVMSYTVTAAKGTESVTYTANSTSASDTSLEHQTIIEKETKITMTLVPGTWTLTVTGYTGTGATGTAICTGKGSIDIVKTSSGALDTDPGNGITTVIMYPAENGTGTVNLSLTAPSSVTDATATLTGPVTASSAGTAHELTVAETAGAGTNTFTFTNDSGSDTCGSGTYSLVVLLKKTDSTGTSVVYRRTETLYIWPGFVTDSWVVHTAAGSGSSATLVYNPLIVSSGDLADIATTFTGLTVSQTISGSSSPLTSSFTSDSIIAGGHARFFCDYATPVTLALTVGAGQNVVVKDAAAAVLSASSIVKNTDGTYVLAYALPAAKLTSGKANDLADITVYSTSRNVNHTYRLAYGAVAVSSSGSDTAGDGTRSAPYATVTKAASSLLHRTDSAYASYNRIELDSDMTGTVKLPAGTDTAFYGVLTGVNSEDSAAAVHTLTSAGTDATLNAAAGTSLTLEKVNMVNTGTGSSADVSGTVTAADSTLGAVTVRSGGTLAASSGTKMSSIEASAGAAVQFGGTSAVVAGSAAGTIAADTGTSGEAAYTGAKIYADMATVSGTGTIANITPSWYPAAAATFPVVYALDSEHSLTQTVCSRFTVTPQPVTGAADNEFYVKCRGDSTGALCGYITLKGVYVTVSYTDETLSNVYLDCSTSTFTNGTGTAATIQINTDTETGGTALPSGCTITAMKLCKLDPAKTAAKEGSLDTASGLWTLSCTGVSPAKYNLVVTGTVASGETWSASKEVTVEYAQ